MFISQAKLSNHVKHQITEMDHLRSTKISENIRATQGSQKLRMSKRSSLINPSSQNSSPTNLNSVKTIYTELHTYIQNLDQKIHNLLEKQSNEYKVVYQHYYNKFKQELQELKQKTLQQEKQFRKNDHVQCLESELKILREQVAAYKCSYQEMKKKNDQLKAAMKFYRQDVVFLENNVKNRIKEIKLLTSQNFKLESQVNRQNLNQDQELKNQKYNSKDFKRRSHSMNIDELSQPQIKVQFHKYNPNPAFQSLVSTRNIYEEYFFTDQSTKENKTDSNRSLIEKKSNHSFKERIKYTHETSVSKERRHFHTQESQKAEKSSKMFNICEWFLNCVETVRKQIFHRKSELNTFQLDRINNGFRYLNSLDDFMKLDKLQVIKLFLSSEEIITIMYHLLKSQKKFEVQDQKQKMFFQKENNYNEESQGFDSDQEEKIQTRFTNLALQKNANQRVKNKTMTDMKFFDWKLVEKAHKFQNFSQFSTTAAAPFTKNRKRSNESPQMLNSLLSLNSKKNQEQKNIKMMKKITAIINKKKSMPLTSQLFVRKKNFIIE